MDTGQALTRFFISIHALRKEGDVMDTGQALTRFFISIHALRKEGDGNARPLVDVMEISIHALRKEGDRWTRKEGSNDKNFYPRPPQGGRRTGASSKSQSERFLSTPSARRATAANILENSMDENFYPRPPQGGRRRP